MRRDLVLRYLITSVERLNLTQRHLEGAIVNKKEDNKGDNHDSFSATLDSPVDFFILTEHYLEMLQVQINSIESVLQILKEDHLSV